MKKVIIFPVVCLLLLSSCQLNKALLNISKVSNSKAQNVIQEQMKLMDHYRHLFNDQTRVLCFNKRGNYMEHHNYTNC